MYSAISTFLLHFYRVFLKMEIAYILHCLILLDYYRLVEFHPKYPPLLKIENPYLCIPHRLTETMYEMLSDYFYK
jgi:hypothetical protein